MIESQTANAAPRFGLFARISILVSAVSVIASSALLVIDASELPVADQWDFLFPELYLRDLFHLHNEHRLAVPSLVFAIDSIVFHSSNWFNRGTIVAVGLAHGALLAGLARRPTDRPREMIFVVGVASSAMMSAIAWNNLIWGFQVQFVGVFFFASVAIASVVSLRPSTVSTAFASASLVLAAFSMGNGVLVGPFVFGLAFFLRRPRRHLAVLGAVSVATLAFYFHDYHSPHSHTSLAVSITKPIAVLRYAMMVLGGPLVRLFARFRPLPGAMVGFVGLVLLVRRLRAILRAANHQVDRFDDADVALPAIAGFAAVTAVVMGLGRLEFAPMQAFSSRYATVGLVFWCALALDFLRNANAVADRRVAGRLCAVFVGYLAIEQPMAWREGFKHVRAARQAETAVLAGAYDVRALGAVAITPDSIVPFLPELRARRWSVFHPESSRWLGDRLRDRVTPLERDCDGAIERIVAVPALGEGAYRVSGRVTSGRGDDVIERLLFVDDEERIVGYGATEIGFRAAERFAGHVGAISPGAHVTAHALLRGGRSCRIPSFVVVPRPGPILVAASELDEPLRMHLELVRDFGRGAVPFGVAATLQGTETYGSLGASGPARLVWRACASEEARSFALPVLVSAHTIRASIRIRSELGTELFRFDDLRAFTRWSHVRIPLPPTDGDRCVTIDVEENDDDERAFVAVATPHELR